VVTSDDDDSGMEELVDETQTSTLPTRPRPRPAYRSAAPAEARDPLTETDDDPDEVIQSAPHVTLKDPNNSTRSPSKSLDKGSQVNGTSTPKTPRKREREVENGDQSATDREGSLGHSDDIQVRRKRVRH
jgi:hypothetical protein